MSKSFHNREMSKEQIAHDIALSVVRTSTEGYQRGNDYQISDQDIARYAFSVYDDCFHLIRQLIEEK